MLAFGYGSLQQAITDGPAGISIGILLAIALGKILTTSLTIGSGGSGGVFGPSMVIGGCGGGALGLLSITFGRAWCRNPASFVIVGMAGFFAAAAKTPFSTLIIVSEMTGGYHLLLPACGFACWRSCSRTRNRSTRPRWKAAPARPAHQGSFVREVLEAVYVRQFLVREQAFQVMQPGDSLAVVLDRLDESLYTVLPVVDAENRLLGVIDLEERTRPRTPGTWGRCWWPRT